MTRTAAKPIASTTHQALPGTLQLQWRAVRSRERHGEMRTIVPQSAFERVTVAASLEFINEDRAILEARIESRDRVERVIRHCTVAIVTAVDAIEPDLRHLDCVAESGRILALSYRVKDEALLYAHAAFLCESGFAPGALDAPTLRIIAASSDAATA